MSDGNYNQVFILPDGEEIKVRDNYMGRYLALPIQRIYNDPENQADNQLMDDKWENLNCRKIEVTRDYVRKTDHKIRKAIETMIIAEKKDWTEYPLVKNYDADFCCNCDYYTKIEVVLMAEEYSRRLFFDWNGNMSVADFIANCVDEIVQNILEEPDSFYAKIENDDNDLTIYLEFYTDDGEYCELELHDYEIEKMIASVRVVEFTRTINNKS